MVVRSREPRTTRVRRDEKKFISIKRGNRFATNVVRETGESTSSGPSASVRPTGDPVATGVARAARAWRSYLPNRDFDRDSVYGYLNAVYEVIQEWRRQGKAKEYSLAALKRADFPIRMKPDPYARLIFCTSTKDDAKKRWKWAKVMRWVATHNKKGRSFMVFVKKNGGLNKCTQNASDEFDPDWT
jgi:hypothetical protein